MTSEEEASGGVWTPLNVSPSAINAVEEAMSADVIRDLIEEWDGVAVEVQDTLPMERQRQLRQEVEELEIMREILRLNAEDLARIEEDYEKIRLHWKEVHSKAVLRVGRMRVNADNLEKYLEERANKIRDAWERQELEVEEIDAERRRLEEEWTRLEDDRRQLEVEEAILEEERRVFEEQRLRGEGERRDGREGEEEGAEAEEDDDGDGRRSLMWRILDSQKRGLDFRDEVGSCVEVEEKRKKRKTTR